jgi:hypothetical protein
MPITRRNPLDVSVISAVQSPEEVRDQINDLVRRIRQVDTDMVGWLQRQAELIKLRKGNRQTKKSVPWRNSSNISVPLTDGIIRRWKPLIASLVLDADPIAFMRAREAGDTENARLAEKWLTYLFVDEMETTMPAVQLADTIAWHGHAYTRESWDYRTIRQVRVITVEKVFKPSLQEFLQGAQLKAQAEKEDFSPEDSVMTQLELEYDLDRDDQQEGPALLQMTQQILKGDPYIKLAQRKVIKDAPRWEMISPLFTIVPQDQDPEDAEFFTIIHMKTEDELRAMGIDGHLPRDRVEAMISQGSKSGTANNTGATSDSQRDIIQDLLDSKAGNTRRHSERATGRFPVWEVYCRLNLTGKEGAERQRVVLWYSPQHDRAIALNDYVFPFDTWPITYYPFEAAKRPIDNAGISEKVKTMQKLVNAYHNMRIDAGQLMLSPVLKVRVTGGNMKKNFKVHPGAMLPVQSPGDVEPLMQDLRILTALTQEEQSNQRLAETYIGVFDATLTNISQSRERRTAAEVNAIQGLSANIFGLDSKIFQVSFSKSLNKIWNLWQELGDDEVFIRVQGEEPITVRKADIGMNFDISAAGTPANTNRSFQISTLERALQLVLSSPLILQSGRFDFIQLLQDYLALLDRNMSKRLIRSEEQAAAVQQIVQAGAAVSGQEPAQF